VALPSCKKDAEDPVVARARRAIEALTPGVRVVHRADDVLVVTKGSASLDLVMDNPRRSCASSDDECEDALQGMAKIVHDDLGAPTGQHADVAIDKARIRLTPKPLEWFQSADETLKTAPKPSESRILRTPFAADLMWVYVSDEEHGMRLLSAGDLAKLGMSLEELHTLAVQNLMTQYPELKLLQVGPGVETIDPGDYLASARLALVEQWRAKAEARGGVLFVTAPARSRVFVADGPNRREGLDRVTTMAFKEEDHPLSTAVLRWTGSGWQAVDTGSAASGR
jgi:hypothetical protein